jgi:hypothetical protein
MKFWQWSEIRTKVEQECDLEDEDFVRRSELLSYANEAIEEAEAEILGLYEDYFLKSSTINVSAAQEDIPYPTDIYAQKIRRIIYFLGNTTNPTNYPITRLKDWKKFEYRAVADTGQTTDLYQWMDENAIPGSPIIKIVPKLREAGIVKLWYIRHANRLTVDTDICDIPEFINFIFSHMKVKVYEKEGHPMLSQAMTKLEMERQRMLSTLQSKTPDADNDIEMDASYYEDHN